MSTLLQGSLPSSEMEMGYGQLFATLWRRRWWLLSVWLGAIAMAYAMAQRQIPVYESSMQLLVEANYQGRKDSGSSADGLLDSNVQIDTGTQISLMQSSALLKKALTYLQAHYPEMNPKNPQAIADLRSAIGVSQLEGGGKDKTATKIFQVTYSATDPEKTKAVLNALEKVYLEYNREQQRARLDRGLNFINQQLPEAERKVRTAESELEKFRRTQALINPEDQAKAQALTLQTLQQEQQKSRVELSALDDRYRNLQDRLGLSTQEALVASRLSQSPRFQTLLNEIQRTELALVQMRLRFQDAAPEVQTLIQQRFDQTQLLRTELQRIGQGDSSIANDSGLSVGQLGSLDLKLIGDFLETQSTLRTAALKYQETEKGIQTLRSELKRYPQLLAEYGRLEPEIALHRETYKQLLKAKQELGLELARGGFDWQVVETAQLGGSSKSSHQQTLLLGGVVGLVLGGLAAFLRESADDSIHNSDDLAKQSIIPLLGGVPAIAPSSAKPQSYLKKLSGQPIALYPDMNHLIHWPIFRESLDLLYQNLQLLTANSGLKSLIMTSALAGEGKSTIAVGLAMSAARLHQRVLIIDADLRRPSLHKLLNLPNEQGLSTLLASDDPIPATLPPLQTQERSNISVLTAGPSPADPAKLLSSPRMQAAMKMFEQQYDWVIVDAPPAIGLVDVTLLGAFCQGVVLVGRMNQVTRAEFGRAIAALQPLNLLGVIANGIPAKPLDPSYYSAMTR